MVPYDQLPRQGWHDTTMDLGLADRAYVVTGGTRGLGLATARVLVDEGARVVVTGRDQDQAAAAADALGRDVAVGLAADNRDRAAAERIVATTMARFGRVDGALISTGGPPAGRILQVDDNDWSRSFETIMLGGLRIAKAVAAAVGPGGTIAFVLSTSVRSPIPNLAISNGIRAGLAMAAKTLADELGPRDVRVVGLLPGRIATDRLAELDGASGDAAAARRANEALIPLRRYGTPDEFGRVAAFVLSPAASYITGSMITIDGGALRTI
jgi:3-oxoacyl-[acyl-carrier protein] reductase